jgi:hypothetical protein
LTSEAHLPAEARSVAFVRYLRKPRKSLWGWALFAGMILLNETRGLYVVALFLKAYGGH